MVGRLSIIPPFPYCFYNKDGKCNCSERLSDIKRRRSWTENFIRAILRLKGDYCSISWGEEWKCDYRKPKEEKEEDENFMSYVEEESNDLKRKLLLNYMNKDSSYIFGEPLSKISYSLIQDFCNGVISLDEFRDEILKGKEKKIAGATGGLSPDIKEQKEPENLTKRELGKTANIRKPI